MKTEKEIREMIKQIKKDKAYYPLKSQTNIKKDCITETLKWILE